MNSIENYRKRDERLEHEVGNWLDKHFYNRTKNVKVERVKDKTRQCKGIDVLVGSTKVDEKLKIRGLLNSVIEFPSFEVMRIDRSGNYSEGWFIDSGNETEYYAFLSVFSTASSEDLVKESNITKVVYLLVKKSEVSEAIMKSNRKLMDDAEELIYDQTEERMRYFHSAWLKISRHLKEAPVNLVVKRSFLKTLPHTKEIEITKEKVRKL